MRRILALVLLLTACGASPERAPARTIDAVPVAPNAPRPPGRPPAGCLWRRDVLATVDAGLGSFLQHIDVEPHLEGEEFVGFRVMVLRPRAYWSGVDLRPGDIVTSVNGMPIERPTQAFSAFTSLRQATRLDVALIRDGAPRQLAFRIIDDVSGSGSTSPTTHGPVPRPPISASRGA